MDRHASASRSPLIPASPRVQEGFLHARATMSTSAMVAAATTAAAAAALWLAFRPRKLTAQEYVDALGLIAHPEAREHHRHAVAAQPTHSR